MAANPRNATECRETSFVIPIDSMRRVVFALKKEGTLGSGCEETSWWTLGLSKSGAHVDPFNHPDLARIGRDLRTRLDDTLDAEQEAARSAAMRRMSLRDRLILSEDRGERVLVSTVDGHMYRGVVRSVGLDHVSLEETATLRYIALSHVVAFEAR
jgi:hypothetical protein